MRILLVMAVASSIAIGARSGRAVNPETQLKRTCTRCHGLDVVRAQRLSREEWNRELDKMAAMGAKIADREALVAYLAQKYSNRVGDPGERRK